MSQNVIKKFSRQVSSKNSICDDDNLFDCDRVAISQCDQNVSNSTVNKLEKEKKIMRVRTSTKNCRHHGNFILHRPGLLRSDYADFLSKSKVTKN